MKAVIEKSLSSVHKRFFIPSTIHCWLWLWDSKNILTQGTVIPEIFLGNRGYGTAWDLKFLLIWTTKSYTQGRRFIVETRKVIELWKFPDSGVNLEENAYSRAKFNNCSTLDNSTTSNSISNIWPTQFYLRMQFHEMFQLGLELARDNVICCEKLGIRYLWIGVLHAEWPHPFDVVNLCQVDPSGKYVHFLRCAILKLNDEVNSNQACTRVTFHHDFGQMSSRNRRSIKVNNECAEDAQSTLNKSSLPFCP